MGLLAPPRSGSRKKSLLLPLQAVSNGAISESKPGLPSRPVVTMGWFPVTGVSAVDPHRHSKGERNDECK